jgi:hypothetical protein
MVLNATPSRELSEATQIGWRAVGRPVALWVAVAVMSTGCSSCDQQPTYSTRPLPALEWRTPTLPDYGPLSEVTDQAWRQGAKAAMEPLKVPQALETHLDGQERERWEQVLAALIRRQSLEEALEEVVTQRWLTLPDCPAPTATDALPQRWRVEAQRLVQLHRAALWHLGHLEMEALAMHRLLRDTQAQLTAEQSNLIRASLLEPMAQLQRDLEQQDQPATRPDGDWLKGALRPRLARHRPLQRFFDLLIEAITLWQPQVEADATWSHLARALEPHLRAAKRWQAHHRRLVRTFDVLAREHRALSRLATTPPAQRAPVEGAPKIAPSAAPDAAPDAAPATAPEVGLRRCFSLHAHQASLSAQALSITLNMQGEVAAALGHVRWLQHHLPLSDAPRRTDWLAQGQDALASLREQLEARAAALMRFESAISARLDRAHQGLWQALPDVVDPLAHAAPTAPGSATQWRQQFFALKRQPLSKLTQPEPEQPMRKRNKPYPPYISRVIDYYRADAAVAHVEQGLLAISELDAHIARVHELVSPSCAPTQCAALPPGVTPDSPRLGPYVRLWSGLTPDQRHLGHYLIVLELTRLHLARQTDTLARLHAWIAERSTLDGAWPGLEACDETWALYTGADGTYLRFLKRWSELQRDIEAAPNADSDRALSAPLSALLTTQSALSALTIDFARLIDRGQEPPIPLETLLSTWQLLHAAQLRLEEVTLARDAAAAARQQPPQPPQPPKPR